MRRIYAVFLLLFASAVNAGFVADEATWFVFTTPSGYTYYIDPYQTDYLENGDVEILIERLRDGESKFPNNPERLRFNCKTKLSYQAFALEPDGTWKKANDYEIKAGTTSVDWVNLACGMKFGDAMGTYVATHAFTEPTKHNRYIFWEKDKFYPTSISDSKVVKVYELVPLEKGYFQHFMVINCKTRQFGYVTNANGMPDLWNSPGVKNTVPSYLTFQTCRRR